MATYNVGFDYPFSASGDLGSHQYKFVQVASGGGGGTVELSANASGPAPIGVLQNDPESGAEATVRILGVSKLMVNADTAIKAGDFLTSSSTGQGITTSTASQVAALALESVASGSGVIIKALLLPFAGNNKTDNAA